jgi:hypothetical protein
MAVHARKGKLRWEEPSLPRRLSVVPEDMPGKLINTEHISARTQT